MIGILSPRAFQIAIVLIRSLLALRMDEPAQRSFADAMSSLP